MSVALRTEEVDIRSFPMQREFFQAEDIGVPERKIAYSVIKRLFDIVFSLIGLILFLVPMAVIALIVTLDSRGGPIYFQKRLGKDQKPFTIIKFRTMQTNAEVDGAKWAARNDPRRTRFGRFLRHSHLDELPQLLNILVGHMSFVGPRPERPEFYDAFDSYIGGFRQRMLVLPGLTGLAQINGGYELLPEQKIVYDLDYIKNRSLLLDLRCILKTFAVVLRRRDAR